MRASGCNMSGTTDLTAPPSVPRATTQRSSTRGWRCSKSKMPRIAMKTTLLGSAAFSLLTFSAFGADLGAPWVPPAPLAPPPPAFTWTSCYGGLHAGGGMGQKDLTDTAGVLVPTTGFSAENLNIAGYMVGGQIGCDYQFTSNWVVGVEGSVSGGNIGGKIN